MFINDIINDIFAKPLLFFGYEDTSEVVQKVYF